MVNITNQNQGKFNPEFSRQKFLLSDHFFNQADLL